MSNRPPALQLSGRSSTSRGLISPMASPSPLKLDFGFALRRDGSTGSGRALCRSPSARRRPVTISQSGRGQASSTPRQRPVTSSLFSTLSLGFETERNGNGEGAKSQIVGITLFDDEDRARLSMIVGQNIWNEESSGAPEGISRTDVQEGTPKPQNELERPPTPPPKETRKTEERVKPEPRGSQNVTTSQLATQESQHHYTTEK